MMRRVVLLTSLLAASSASPQESGPSPGETAEARTPVAIPLADVAQRAEELATELRRIEALLEPTPEFEAVASAIDEDAATIAELQRELDAIDPNRISLRKLEDHRLGWSDVDQSLGRSTAGLQGRWADLSQMGEDLERIHGTWEATRSRAVSEEAPPEILELIETQLARTAATRELLRQRMATVASVLDRGVQRKEASSEALQRLADVASELRGRMLARNAPPMWELAGSIGGHALLEEAKDARRYWLETLVSFVSGRREQFSLLLAAFVALSLMGVATRRWSRSWPEDDAELERARFVVSRPFSMAVAFTIVLMVLFFEALVGPLEDLIVFLVLIPILRLGRGIVPQAAKAGFYGLAVLILLDQFWTLAPDGSVFRRAALLIVTLVALAGALLLTAKWRGSDETRYGFFWRLARLLVVFASMLLAASMVANVLGWSHLSESITTSTIDAAFSAHAWLAVVLAAVALVPVAIRSPLGSWFPSLRRHAPMFNRFALVLAGGVALFLWIRGTLHNFQIYASIRNSISGFMRASFTVGGLEVSAGRVSAAITLLALTWLLGRAVRFVLREEVLPRFRLPAGAGHSVVSVANYVVWGSGLLLAAAAAGLSATQLTVVFGALGVGIGFGLQNVVGNFVSGLILIFERPIQVGDSVQTTEHLGIVTNIGIRASTIRTFDGAEVVVPNSDLVAKEFINWTRTDRTRRVEVRVRVGLGTDPRQVLQILRDVALDHDKVLRDPAPSALMTGFGESSLDFRLLAWVRVEDFLGVSSDLHVAVNENLKADGIEIPYPQRDVHVHSEEGESAGRARARLNQVGD